ncbi:MAG: phosphate ABC transporter permease subunit PstC [Planctomycetales bacterium]|nr:phosphate ABC transporter permease subunit PstC [Planctomycetales bacterium]
MHSAAEANSRSATSSSTLWRESVSLRSWGERLIHVGLFCSAALSVLTTLGIVVVLISESLGFFAEVSPWEFLSGTRWSPLIRPQSFGVLPLVCGTVWVAAGAAIIALPLGLASAVYLSEYASVWFREVIKPTLEILAGVPSVVFGYLAVVFISPAVKAVIPSAGVFNAVNAAVVVGIMVLPMVISLSEDVLRSVPRSLREAASALGATQFDVSVRVVVPAGLSGVIASFILAISRAIGETMAVTMAAGATPNLTLNPFESVQTMTAYIAQVSMGDTPAGTIEYHTIFAVGLTLFAITLAMNLLARWIKARYQEVYE